MKEEPLHEQLEKQAEWLDALYIRLQGSEVIFALKAEIDALRDAKVIRVSDEDYREILQDDLERAVLFGIRAGRPMEQCGCLFESLSDDDVPTKELLLKARSEINNLAIYAKQLAIEVFAEEIAEKNSSTTHCNDPFELMHDEMKANSATDKEIGKNFVKTRSPNVQKQFIEKHGSEEDAIKYYVKQCDNLRQRRRKAATAPK